MSTTELLRRRRTPGGRHIVFMVIYTMTERISGANNASEQWTDMIGIMYDFVIHALATGSHS